MTPLSIILALSAAGGALFFVLRSPAPSKPSKKGKGQSAKEPWYADASDVLSQAMLAVSGSQEQANRTRRTVNQAGQTVDRVFGDARESAGSFMNDLVNGRWP